MRTSFELKIIASSLEEAKKTAAEEISAFLDIEEKDVFDLVNLEFKVTYAEAKTRAEITQEMDQPDFVVTVFGAVKQSIAKPFGF